MSPSKKPQPKHSYSFFRPLLVFYSTSYMKTNAEAWKDTVEHCMLHAWKHEKIHVLHLHSRNCFSSAICARTGNIISLALIQFLLYHKEGRKESQIAEYNLLPSDTVSSCVFKIYFLSILNEILLRENRFYSVTHTREQSMEKLTWFIQTIFLKAQGALEVFWVRIFTW